MEKGPTIQIVSGFDLDKHDLFRIAVPGLVFLLVLFSFYYANNDFIFHTGDNIGTFLGSIVIGLTTGYLIHNIYRGIHILSELNRWEIDESAMVQSVLNNEQQINLIVGNSPRDKAISWFIESCLHIKSSEPIRDRGYHLISRIHSLGGSMFAIEFGVLLSIFYLNLKNRISEHLEIFVIVSVVWIIIIYLLDVARTSTLLN